MKRYSGWRVAFMAFGALIVARGVFGLLVWDRVSPAFIEGRLAQLVAGVALVVALAAGSDRSE